VNEDYEYYEDEDEWERYREDDEPELKGTHYEEHLCKAENGHLFIETVYGWCFWGQDWGETVGQWQTKRYRLKNWNDELLPVFIKAGRALAPLESVPVQSIIHEEYEA
jgi:hypothetical protein